MTTKPSSTSNPGPLAEALASCIDDGSKAPNPREAARRALSCMLTRLSAALADDPGPSEPGGPAADPAASVGGSTAHAETKP